MQRCVHSILYSYQTENHQKATIKEVPLLSKCEHCEEEDSLNTNCILTFIYLSCVTVCACMRGSDTRVCDFCA